MNNQIDILLEEYEAITGRSKLWRQDLSIDDFLKLRDYSKTMAVNEVESYDTKKVSRIAPVIENKEATSNAVSPEEYKEKREIKKFVSKASSESTSTMSEEDPVAILKSIKD